MSRALTPRTNFDTLRKDAKRWLKALRAGDTVKPSPETEKKEDKE